MNLFRTKFESLEDLLEEQLSDLYDAEKRLTKAIPKMADAATSPALASAFRHHLQETEGHVTRLEQAFKHLDKKPQREACDAMKGLISEGDDIVSAKGSDNVRDAALIAAAQRVEHYEMAGYGAARTFARQCGRPEIASLLQQTLDEEGAADQRLTQIAEESVNPAAARV